MKIFYCQDCESQMTENEVASGWTKDVDCFENDHCCACGSESIELYDEEDLCPVCKQYHSEDDDTAWEQCYNACYTDARGLLYIYTQWTPEEIIDLTSDLSDSGQGDTMKEIILERGEGIDFIRYICKFDDTRSDIYRNHKIIAKIKSKNLSGIISV